MVWRKMGMLEKRAGGCQEIGGTWGENRWACRKGAQRDSCTVWEEMGGRVLGRWQCRCTLWQCRDIGWLFVVTGRSRHMPPNC